MVEKKTEELIVAEYKLHIHCKECATAVHKHITQNSGVEKVDINVESGKVIVKGYFDAKKVQERIEKKTKKKVELISSKFLPKEEKKEQEIKIIEIKIHLHCHNCEQDIKVLLLKHKEIHKVETNLGGNTCKIIGTIKEKELVEYIQKKTNKVATILKVEAKKLGEAKNDEKDKLKAKKDEFLKKVKAEIEKKKKELKEKEIEMEIDELVRKISVEKEVEKKMELLKVKELEMEMDELFKKIQVEMEKKDFLIMEKDVDVEELFKKMKVKIEEKTWELKEKYFAVAPYNYYYLHHAHHAHHAPSWYNIHSPSCYSPYAQAPQWFSDEDPNACAVM